MSKSQFKRLTSQGVSPEEAAVVIRGAGYQDGLERGRVEGILKERRRIVEVLRDLYRNSGQDSNVVDQLEVFLEEMGGE